MFNVKMEKKLLEADKSTIFSRRFQRSFMLFKKFIAMFAGFCFWCLSCNR